MYRNKNTPFRLSALTANRVCDSTALIQHEQSVSDSVHVHVRGIRSDRMRPTFVSLRSPTVHAAIASLFGTSAVWAHGQRQHPAEQFMCIGGHDGVSRARGDSGSGKVVKLLQDGERGSAELSFYETNSDPVRPPLASKQARMVGVDLRCFHQVTRVLPARFIPKFYGRSSHDGKDAIVLEDLTADMVAPCIADIKVGSQTWRPGTLPSKVVRILYKCVACPLAVLLLRSQGRFTGTRTKQLWVLGLLGSQCIGFRPAPRQVIAGSTSWLRPNPRP